MRSLTFLLAVLLLSAVVALGGATNKPVVFELKSDTLLVYVGTRSQQVTLDQIDEYDTTRAGDAPFIIITSKDTFVVTPQDEPFNCILKAPSGQIYETILFPDTKLNILRSHEAFGDTDPPDLPPFSYTDSSDKRLRELRATFNLDSIAGNGSDVERVLNLLEWAHTVVRHEGSSTNPAQRDALSIIQVCRDEDRGVNCRMMATILNEACLAMGFKSRHVTCQPMDKDDPDCHVTNMVFVPSLDKWIYVDPTFGGYFMDEDSAFLNFAEIRERLIHGDSLILPNDMDWNGQPRARADYLAYMTKNMFRFSVPLASAPGYESDTSLSSRAWVHLNPRTYDADKCGTVDTTVGKSGTSYLDYYTDDADHFWASPR